MARKTSTTPLQPTTPPTYSAWKIEAAAGLMKRYGIRDSAVREQAWRNF